MKIHKIDNYKKIDLQQKCTHYAKSDKRIKYKHLSMHFRCWSLESISSRLIHE